MRIGIPTEIKTLEGRVALIPSAAGELVSHGHEVFLQSGAGNASGYPDARYAEYGVQIVADAAEAYGRAELVLKVKEPVAAEYPLLRPDHILFCYLHLAAVPELTSVLVEKGLTAVAWETVEENGRLPLLAPMSEVAGTLAVQLATNLLYRPNGGRGLMLGGMAAAERGHVVVLGAGSVGLTAARLAAAIGARVTVFELRRDRLAEAHLIGPNVTALPGFEGLIRRHVIDADVVVGGVLVPGGRAPILVSADTVGEMQDGAVIIDVAVDQGGCIETIRPTTWSDPTYTEHGVIHFGVTNMPGAVPRTSAQALSTALTPYVLRLAAPGGLADPALATGINVRGGAIVHPAVAAAHEA